MSENKQITLQVLEAYTRDVGRNAARIDYDTMDSLGVKTGDPIRINNKTASKVLPLYPSDEGKSIIRVDVLVRNNAGLKIGETTDVVKTRAPPCEDLSVKPLEAIPPIDERYLADALESVCVTIGDNVIVPYFGGRLTFSVINFIPGNEQSVQITQRTICHIMGAEINKDAPKTEIINEMSKIMGSLTSVLEKINRL